MFSLLSILIHIINSIFSGVYTSQFLKEKCNRKITIIIWTIVYFGVQMLIFDIIHSQYSFNNMTSAIINILLLIGMQLLFFCRDASSQLFVCVSFVAGKEIIKYVVSVLNVALGALLGNWVEAFVMQGKIVTNSQVVVISNMMVYALTFASAIFYALILGIYLLLIHKNYVRKEYPLRVQENVFLILPSIVAICISITLKMLIVIVENGMTTLVYDSVPETLFWIPVICVLLLGAVIANVILFQNVVQYHEENRKRTLLENQVLQMQKEIQEIQDIYTDMRGLRHDLRGHINNIMQYMKKYINADEEEINGYIRNMEKTVSRLDFGYQSGNPITDIILQQKKLDAERVGVTFSVDFHYPKKLQIDVYDVGVILNNALENAIEAASLSETDKDVSLQSYVKGNLFFIEVENNFTGELTVNKESCLPESRKVNKKYHGMGLINIQRCARKYRGDMDIVIATSEQGQQIFNLTVMLNGKPIGA